MSVGINNNIYPTTTAAKPENNINPWNLYQTNYNYNGMCNGPMNPYQYNNNNNINYQGGSNGENENKMTTPLKVQQNQQTLPFFIKDKLIEMSFVAREFTNKNNSNSKKTKTGEKNEKENPLMKKVSEILNAYLSNLEIINQQYTYLTNALNPNINKNNSFQHPVITSLINFNDKVDTLLKKIKEWNEATFKCFFSMNKLNKYFENVEKEWKNLLLNISLNNISTKVNDKSLNNENYTNQISKELDKNPLEIYINGEKFFYGIGTEKSYTKAFEKYTKSAECGMPEAMYMLGLMYEKNYGKVKDICMAIYWYNEAIKHNYGKAFYALGNIYENGIGVLKNDKKAFELYKNGSDIGDVDCFTSLGRMYENGNYVNENINKAIYWYQLASQKNCPKAQLALGKIYYYGMNPNHIQDSNPDSNMDDKEEEEQQTFGKVEKNFTEAIKLFQKSAEQGEAEAQVYLGLCYENGYGVVKDYLMAKMNFEKASKQNNILGALYLGKIYMKENNTNAALNNFLRALSKGSVDALYYIGKLYDTKEEDENLISAYIRNVIGEADLTFKPCSSSYFMASDKNISIKYYLQAAEKGHSLAQYRLGNYHCTQKQYIIALYWYLKSSHLAKTQNALGQFYELGFDEEFQSAASMTGLTLKNLIHYSVDQLFSFYHHYRQMVLKQKKKTGITEDKATTTHHSNLKEAKKWYYRSIRQGYGEAAFNLGQLYETRCYDLINLTNPTEATKDDDIADHHHYHHHHQDHSMKVEETYDPTTNDDFSQQFCKTPSHRLTHDEIVQNQSRYIQKSILLYEKAKKLGCKKGADRLKQLQSIAYSQKQYL